jgi:hypothetical protein
MRAGVGPTQGVDPQFFAGMTAGGGILGLLHQSLAAFIYARALLSLFTLKPCYLYLR